jgi:hypothetical protein
MTVRNINEDLNINEPAMRTWSDGSVDNIQVRGQYRGRLHVTSNTQNYFALKASGARIPPRYLSYWRSHWQANRGSMTYRDDRPGARSATYSGPYDLSSFNGDPGDFTWPSNEEWASLRRRAEASVLQKIKNQKVNLAQMFAERGQTANLIASTANRLASCYNGLRRGNIAAAATALGVPLKPSVSRRYKSKYPKDPQGAAANAWLELQYGWKPLLQDVYGSAEAVADAHLGKAVYQTAKSTMSDKISVMLTSSNSEVEKSRHCTASYQVKVSCTFQYSNPGLHDAKALGLTNPALLAWELLPYSFVVDWFLPVGDALSNLDATIGCSFVDGFVVTVLEQNVDCNVRGVGLLATYPGGYKATYTGALHGSKWRKQIDLTPLNSFPEPSFPRFKNPFSTSHVTSALSLLQTAFRR